MMQTCAVCGGTKFYKEAGYFFCEECQTQNEELREEVLEMHVNAGTRLKKTKVRAAKSVKSDQVLGWTTWERYNFVLIGLTNELIELGVTPHIKLTVLQLWATYLGKIEVAFTSTKKQNFPKLARQFHKKDAEIIYGKTLQQKRSVKRKRLCSTTSASSMISGQQSGLTSVSKRELNKRKSLMAAAEYDKFIQTQASSEGDAISLTNQSFHSLQSSVSRVSTTTTVKFRFSKHAKEESKKVKLLSEKLPRNRRKKFREKYVTGSYLASPYVTTPAKLWAILYIALRIHKQNIQLGDMLRYSREGHLSYYKLDHLLPPDMQVTTADLSTLTTRTQLSHRGMRQMIMGMVKLLEVREMAAPDLLPLITYYCRELQLPRGILLYTERFIAFSPPQMPSSLKSKLFPNYEGRAMAFIIVVLKVLFALDGVTEYEMSRFAEEMNSKLRKKSADSPRIGPPCIIVHGGAHAEANEAILVEKMVGCTKSVSLGYRLLMNGKTSIDAVESAIWWMENDEFFNCGYGSVLNELGEVQMDAILMDGNKFECGSVAAVSDIEHPISLAKYILKKYPNTIVTGEGAKRLAHCAGMQWISKGNMIAPSSCLAMALGEKGKSEVSSANVEELQYAKILEKSWGTVGCIAWDGRTVAVGVSTGGLNRKMCGRVGDSPFLGCGAFANACAGCCLTGHGESLIKMGSSRTVVADITEGYCPGEALQRQLDSVLKKTNNRAGGIALQRNGSWGVYFTSSRMPYAVIKNDWITYGASLDEKNIKRYYDPDTVWPCRCK